MGRGNTPAHPALMLYAEVAVEAGRRVDRETYTYSIPAGLDLVPGQRVTVPFGKRSVRGFVTRVGREVPDIDVKPIAGADPEPFLLPHQVELARMVANHYWAPLIDVLGRMLPPRVRYGKSSGEGESSRQRRHSLLLDRAAVHASRPNFELTPEQAGALATVRGSRALLLYGVTGGGKTEVYLRAAAEVLATGQRVLVLVPDIAITPQLVARFGQLGVGMGIMHSQLTQLERAQQWWKIRRGQVDLVLGSRSAVFAPIPRLGLICLDEEGASSYKQDQMPRYEAGWVARRLAEITAAKLIMGSATPSLPAYHAAIKGRLALASLPSSVMGTRARIELVDMREEIRAGHRQALSRALLQAADRSLESGEQVIMFLNRRGLATFFLCSDCGRSIQCPGCSVSMVQHQDLVCHYCGYSVPIPDQCPGCGGKRVKGLGMGTQRLESLIRKTWPAARVLRLDRDTARGVDGYLEIYEAFESGRADVLVGTELVAKGFDIERVTAVGVIDADMPLHFPDYRSAETTFGLLTQVAGRAGRGHRPARVVAQTTNPEHYSLRLAAQGDYDAFYRAELPGRKVFNFPPFTQLARMTYSHTDEHQARITAEKAAADLAAAIDSEGLTGIEVLGPSPAFLQKLRGEFRWQVTVKGPNLDPVRNLVPQERGWAHDVDPYW